MAKYDNIDDKHAKPSLDVPDSPPISSPQREAAASGPAGPFFFRFFVRLGKMAGEFFPATLWVVIIQQILRSEGRYYHQLDRGWRFPTRPCFKPHPANFRATG